MNNFQLRESVGLEIVSSAGTVAKDRTHSSVYEHELEGLQIVSLDAFRSNGIQSERLEMGHVVYINLRRPPEIDLLGVRSESRQIDQLFVECQLVHVDYQRLILILILKDIEHSLLEFLKLLSKVHKLLIVRMLGLKPLVSIHLQPLLNPEVCVFKAEHVLVCVAT